MGRLIKACFAVILCFALTYSVESSSILVVAPFFGRSHSMFIHSIVSELANRGHDITMISSNAMQHPHEKVKVIKSTPTVTYKNRSSTMFDMANVPMVFKAFVIWNNLLGETEHCLTSPEVQEFLVETDNHFDLVISELFFQESLYMFAHKYKAPLILLCSSAYWSNIDEFMGHPSSLSYLPNEFTQHYTDLNLYQRMVNFFVGNLMSFGNKWYLRRNHEHLAHKYFSHLPQPLPSIEDIEKNVSLVLLNTHYTFDSVRPVVPGVVEIGGIHIKPPKALPEDIKKFLDDAKDGAIFLSFGSYLKSSEMSDDKLKIFFDAFKSLKQKILWKWDGENHPKSFPNIYFSNWMPQSDILAHSNIRLFISHGGMLSTQEAVSRGVPILGISVFGDQYLNMEKIKSKRMGLHIPFTILAKDNFNASLHTILNDRKFIESAKTVSRRYHDQQNTPTEKAMYWIEYVIRHNGASFMKSKLVNFPWYKYYFLDVYLVLFIAVLILSRTKWIVLPFLRQIYFTLQMLVYVFLSRVIRIIRSFGEEGVLKGIFNALKFIIMICVLLYSTGFVVRLISNIVI